MKALKFIGILLLVVIVLGAIGWFIPSKLDVSTSATIDRPASMVMNQVVDFSNFTEWDPWSEMDSTVKYTFEGEPGAVGHKYSWSSEAMGEGSMEIASIEGGEVHMNLVFGGDWDSPFDVVFNFEEMEESTKVTWSMHGEVNMTMGLFMNGAIEQNFTDGLSNLKERVEAMPMPAPIEVSVVDFPERTYIAVRELTSWSDIGNMFTNNLGTVYGAVMAAGLEMTTQPSGLFYTWDEENQQTDMAAGVGVANADAAVDGFVSLTEGGGQALFVAFLGSYDDSGNAHYAIEEYAKQNGITLSGVAIEEYMNDPTTVEESEILTHIYYPIASDDEAMEGEM